MGVSSGTRCCPSLPGATVPSGGLRRPPGQRCRGRQAHEPHTSHDAYVMSLTLRIHRVTNQQEMWYHND